MRTALVLPMIAGAMMLYGTGCSHDARQPQTVAADKTAAPYKAPKTTTTLTAGSVAAPYKSQALSVSSDLMQQCNVQFDSTANSPKFEFDQSALGAQDRTILEQIAKCVTTGPLAGRSLKLVGRTDPRGSQEYNMALGERRASEVGSYLANLGVAKEKMTDTSRGELDAKGKDEAGWQQDRRVDITLP